MNPRVLMGVPDYFGIKYEINPWMEIQNAVEESLALSQWDKVFNKLLDLKVDVELIPTHPDIPDMIFTANGGLIDGSSAVIPNFRFDERKPEQKYFEKWFDENGFKNYKLDSSINFEGEGDCLVYKDLLIGGWGERAKTPFRTDQAAYEYISKWLDKEVVTLKLINPYHYHLDTCFLPLDDAVVYYPKAFDDPSLKKIKDLKGEKFELNQDEANCFSANSYLVGQTVIGNIQSKRLQDFLESHGHKVFHVDTSEFIKAGGSVKCLILNLN